MEKTANLKRSPVRRFVLAGGFVLAAAACGYAIVGWCVARGSERTVARAKRFLLREDADEARRTLNWLLWFEPQHAEARYLLGRSQRVQKKYPEAIASFQRALANQRPEAVGSLLHEATSIDLARTLLANRQYAASEAAFQRHLEWYPASNSARASLKELLQEQHRDEEAVRLLEERWELVPDDLSVLPDLLSATIPRGFDDAAAFFEQVNQQRPGQANVLATLGYARWQLGRFDKAEGPLRDALRIDPQHRRARFALAEVLTATDRVDEAETLIDGVDAQRDHWYWSLQARIAERRGAYAPALKAIERALELQPARPEYHSQQARLLQRLGKAEEAPQAYARAAELGKAHFRLASLAMRISQEFADESRCLEVAELCDIVEKPKWAAGWRLLAENVRRFEARTQAGSQPADINEVFIIHGE